MMRSLLSVAAVAFVAAGCSGGLARETGSASVRGPSTRPDPGLAIVYHEPFPDACPAVNPTDARWQEPPFVPPDIQSGPSFEFPLVRATLFGVWEGDGSGCLRVDLKSPPAREGSWRGYSWLLVLWDEGPLVRLDELVPFELRDPPPDTISSVGINVRCTSVDRDACLKGSVHVRDGASQGSNVTIRSGREL
jgi:hypothetical protein